MRRVATDALAKSVVEQRRADPLWVLVQLEGPISSAVRILGAAIEVFLCVGPRTCIRVIDDTRRRTAGSVGQVDASTAIAPAPIRISMNVRRSSLNRIEIEDG